MTGPKDLDFNEDELVPELDTPDELTLLKSRAKTMGISFHPSIGVDALKGKIEAALTEQQNTVKEDALEKTKVNAEVVVEGTESVGQFRARMRKEASALIRCNITCMNPAKREWDGDIFTVSNAVVGTFRKFVQFNTSDGYHVPSIILKQIKAAQCQVFKTAIDERTGEKSREGVLIKEYAVELLPPLTQKELDELAKIQAARK